MIARCLAVLLASLVSLGLIYGITYAAQWDYQDSLQIGHTRVNSQQ